MSAVGTISVQRLGERKHGVEPAGWLCRICDFSSCGRARGDCPAANAAQANATGSLRTTDE
jgi:hypothetical protein